MISSTHRLAMMTLPSEQALELIVYRTRPMSRSTP